MKTRILKPLSFFGETPFSAETKHWAKHWKSLTAMGIAYVILGLIAFSMPFFTSVGLEIALSILLILSGISQLAGAFSQRQRDGIAFKVFQGILGIIAGSLMLRYPGGGMLSIALVLSFYFLLNAATQGAFAISMHKHVKWGWGLLSAAASLFLGLYILFTFPFSAFWVPGLLLGVDLGLAGVAAIALAISVRSSVPYSRRVNSNVRSQPWRASTV